MKVTDNLQSEVKDGMLQLASGKSVPVMMNCAALSDLEKTNSLCLPILRGEIDGREVDVKRDTGCEGVVVRRQLVDMGQLTGIVLRVPLEKDIVGPINPPSEAGHRFILTLLGYATRYAEAVPLRKIDTESVAEALVDIYSRPGIAEEVLSDQGTQFMSDCMKKVCRLLGIKKKATTPYHPMCNRLVERFNATLKTCLSRLCGQQPRRWHRYINPLMFAYREVPQESTHFAPFELLYGRTVRAPMHILRELWTKDIEEPEVNSSYEYVLNLQLGGWGSNETVNELQYGDQLTPDQQRQLEEIASSYSSIFSDRSGTVST
ncbi:Pol polyprotein [Elysia marginata]|uniref:Pol polyprotein n=1 Tax=Elysia marginata TaxID=1093978 RepID=A0AAV4G8H3_9GAST|nr:Pol polyprotein [Elysia marginata]